MKKNLLTLLFLLQLCYVSGQNQGDTIHVAHYDIHLSVVDFTNKIIDGYTDLAIVSKITGLQAVKLDLATLTVDSVFVNSMPEMGYLQTTGQIFIPVSSVLQGDTILMRVYYHGIPEKDPSGFGGFYFSGNIAYNMGVGMSVVPHSYGRAWFPCLDLFTDKSSYNFNIRTTSDKKAICGGMLADSISLSDNTIIWQWHLPDPIPTYLASVAVGNYQKYQDTIHGLERVIPVEIYGTPAYINQVPGSFATLKEVFRNFERLWGAYSWQRVGYVLVPFSSGAMEHATNISYPQGFVNGNLAYESLFAHELSHAWFGNLITCETAEDMWINEGFARYNELITEEWLHADPDPNIDGYKVGARSLMRDVLLRTHTSDGGFYALNQVPINKTYGSTTYDKGAAIVHTLRSYMGNSLFFNGIKTMMTQYRFQNVSSQSFIDSLSKQTGINLNDFYQTWINQPGFPHFSIDSIRRIENSNQYIVAVKQQRYHGTQLADNQPIDITFFTASGTNQTISNNLISGETTLLTLTLPFEPLFGVIDYHEKMCDAVIDYNYDLTTTGNKTATDAGFALQVTHVGSAPTWLRVERHLVAPDPLRASNPNIYLLSDAHYWKVSYIPDPNFEAVLQFRYQATNATYLDYPLLHQGYSYEDLVLLYRKDASQEWRIVPFSNTGNQYAGYLKATNMQIGEYALGMGNAQTSIVSPASKEEEVHFFPNPAKNEITFSFDEAHTFTTLSLFDNTGKLCLKKKITGSILLLQTSSLPTGNYVAVLTRKDKSVKRVKIVLQ
ncbi:MAG: T9SS type A sorting domain-containing protein [Bacteroidales bacterium]|jgi:aminopeptidase N|nr:T9SS type A sorting domain-containing protein [Bacteroidales bacterium]